MRRFVPWLLLAIVFLFVAWKLHTSPFDFHGFVQSLRTANKTVLIIAILVVYSNNVVRAIRWALFLRPALRQAALPRVPWYHLVGAQLVGFTGLAIFGRIGELIRPILVARRTGLTVSSQIALVTVERVFDLGAFGLIFSLNLLFSPQLQSLPYLHKAGYTIAGLTIVLLLFVAGVRLAGSLVATVSASIIAIASPSAAEKVKDKILTFRHGLDVIDSLPDFFLAAFLSLFLWATIAAAYVLILKAFPAPVSTLTIADTIVLMGFSIAGSALPIPGGSGAWAGNVFALIALFHLPTDLAGSAGLILWAILTLAVVPAGLIAARIEGTSLRSAVNESSAAPTQEAAPL